MDNYLVLLALSLMYMCTFLFFFFFSIKMIVYLLPQHIQKKATDFSGKLG